MGVEIREARAEDASGIARVHVESWRTTYVGTISDSYLSSLSASELEPRWRERLCSARSVAFVAETADCEIIGFATGGPREEKEFSEYDAELYTLYLLRGYQRNGLGGGLFTAVTNELHRSGRNSMLLWVLSSNSARQFYERLGGSLLGDQEIEIAGVRLTEVAYGWAELDKTAKRCEA